jgi:hypothetical protein
MYNDVRRALGGVATLGTQRGGELDQATVIDSRPSVCRASWGTILVLGAVTVLALWFLMPFAFPYLTLDQQRFGPYWPRRSWLLLHITGGMVALLIGPAQLWLGLTRQRMRRLVPYGWPSGKAMRGARQDPAADRAVPSAGRARGTGAGPESGDPRMADLFPRGQLHEEAGGSGPVREASAVDLPDSLTLPAACLQRALRSRIRQRLSGGVRRQERMSVGSKVEGVYDGHHQEGGALVAARD